MTAEVKVGKIYAGRVVSIKEFGAFIEIAPETDGLCHVSELSDRYVQNVTDVVNIGDEVRVKVILIDDQGRIKLSRKAAMKEEGLSDPEPVGAPAGPGDDAGNQGGGGGGGHYRGGGPAATAAAETAAQEAAAVVDVAATAAPEAAAAAEADPHAEKAAPTTRISAKRNPANPNPAKPGELAPPDLSLRPTLFPPTQHNAQIALRPLTPSTSPRTICKIPPCSPSASAKSPSNSPTQKSSTTSPSRSSPANSSSSSAPAAAEKAHC